MSANDVLLYQFSPLYRDRKVLIGLRWCFGFPLKATNTSFNDIVFEPCLEYVRYFVFLFSFLLSISFIIWKIKEANDLDAFTAAYHLYFWYITI